MVALRSAPLARDLTKMYVDERLLALRTGVPNDPSIVWVEEPKAANVTTNITTAPEPRLTPKLVSFDDILAEFQREQKEGRKSHVDMD